MNPAHATLMPCEPRSPVWHAIRQQGIGGSDVAALLGISPYKSAYQLYLEKRGEYDPLTETETRQMYWGRRHESLILEEYAIETQREVIVPGGVFRHVDMPFMLASLDGVAEGRVVEGKASRIQKGWGEPGTADIPWHYILQCQHYLTVTGFQEADVAVLIGGDDFRIYTVYGDAELQGMLVEAEEQFWRQVLKGDPPTPRTVAEAQHRFRDVMPEPVKAEQEILDVIHRLKSVRTTIKEYQEYEDKYIVKVMNAMGEKTALVDETGEILVTWRPTKPRELFDKKQFQKDYPELCATYTDLGKPSRRFVLK